MIETLPGYAGSRPVRIGNLANQQVQLDVFGPVVELVAEADRGAGQAHRRPTGGWCRPWPRRSSRRWHEPDHGIWEERHAPRHHVYSKVMCWMTIDRAIKLAERYGRQPTPSWPALREQIAD